MCKDRAMPAEQFQIARLDDATPALFLRQRAGVLLGVRLAR
jgi:hypothetical protein